MSNYYTIENLKSKSGRKELLSYLVLFCESYLSFSCEIHIILLLGSRRLSEWIIKSFRYNVLQKNFCIIFWFIFYYIINYCYAAFDYILNS
jgi:hypothetical protein